MKKQRQDARGRIDSQTELLPEQIPRSVASPRRRVEVASCERPLASLAVGLANCCLDQSERTSWIRASETRLSVFQKAAKGKSYLLNPHTAQDRVSSITGSYHSLAARPGLYQQLHKHKSKPFGCFAPLLTVLTCCFLVLILSYLWTLAFWHYCVEQDRANSVIHGSDGNAHLNYRTYSKQTTALQNNCLQWFEGTNKLHGIISKQ